MGNDMKIKVELPELVNKTFEKPATTLGDKLSDLIEIIFGGITYSKEMLAYKRALNFEEFKKSLAKKVDEIPVASRIEPSESIVGPALEAAKYRIDTEELREMFSSLISASLDTEKVSFVHPAFVEIIKNLSPQDAEAVKYLAYVKDSHIVPIISIDEKVMSIPNNCSHYCFLSDKFGFYEANTIISSLLRCGLIELNYVFSKDTNFQGFTFDDMEGKFSELRRVRNIGRNLDNPLSYKYGVICLTALGYEFSKICIPDAFVENKGHLQN